MKNKEEMTATISASTGLFDFLKEKVGDRKTRTEAYCDLLDKSLAGFVSPFLRKQDFQLQQGKGQGCRKAWSLPCACMMAIM